MSTRSTSSVLLLAIVAVAGAGTMTVELAAVRVLAPWFGASSGVWTNVIGVVLLALALGYLLGARLSRTGSPLRRLGASLCLAALPIAWLPALAKPVADLFLPEGLALDEAASLMIWGSLATSIVLFLPAALALGCVGPLAVEALQVLRGGHAGDAGGRVLGASTLGSLVGTFGTTHLFLPWLGISTTFYGAGALLGLLGISAWLWGRRAPAVADGSRLVAIAPLMLVPAALTSLGGGYVPPAVGEGLRLIEARQSAYQALRVVEAEADAQGQPGLRMLQVNESLDSFQSVWQAAPGLLPAGFYYNLFSLPAWWEDERPTEWSTLILGLGAGTAVRVLEGALPRGVELSSLGLEIDPVVVELGEEHFELERGRPGRRVVVGDARALLRAVPGTFDQLVLDTYANNMEVPAHLASVEFFGELLEMLRPGGWLVVNAAGFGLDDPVVHALSATLASAFEGRVLAVRVPFSRNCVLFARRGAEPLAPDHGRWRFPSAAHGPLLGQLALDGAWRWIEPGGDAPLTDDRNPLDRLQLESVLSGRERWTADS